MDELTPRTHTTYTNKPLPPLLSIDELCKLPDDKDEDDVWGGDGPCIYFLWGAEGELLYIGATTQRGTRILRHYRESRYRYSTAGTGQPIPLKRATFLNCERDGLWDLEYAYQTKYQAPYNVHGLQKRFD
jgi:hypothetical protein